MKKFYLKKMITFIMSFVLLIQIVYLPNPIINTNAADLSLACDYAMEILYDNEGSYTSVNKDDNGALSIGKLQWHGTNALNILKAIVKKNDSNAKTLLGTTLYNEITSSSSWSSRTVKDDEAALIKSLLATNESKSVQDQKGYDYVMGYIEKGANLGIENIAVLVYYADMRNQGANFANDMAQIAKDKAGAYSKITLDIIHEVSLANQNSHFKEKYWTGIKNRRIKTYNFCLKISPIFISYELIPGTYYIKNKSTGTYLNIPGEDKNGSAMSLSAKQETDKFRMIFTPITSGNANNGHYIVPKGCTRAVNPYSDSPTSGTKITLYDKTTDGQQYWCAEPVGTNEYILHLKWNENLVLTGSGTSVTVATNTGATNQIWVLEKDVKLSSIKIDGNSFCNTYEDGSIFNPAGLTLTATYSDGSTQTITEGYALSEVNLDTVGEPTLTAAYGGLSASCTINIQNLFEGSGTAESPYLVKTAADLKNVADMTNDITANGCYGRAHYKQTANIDLSQYPDWEPIGLGFDGEDGLGTYNCVTRMFFGNYDGNNHYIHNLNVDSRWYDAGLFAYIRGGNAVVRNLVVDGIVSAINNAGGIVGQPQYGAKIENCAFIGDVTGGYYAGGIAGYLWCGANVVYSYHNGNVTSEGSSGGIIGAIKFGSYNVDGDTSTVENCYHSYGVIKGTNFSGGIVGECVHYGNTKTIANIKNCYFTAGIAANTTCANATSDNTLALTEGFMKEIAAELGDAYVPNLDETLNNGYPVFEWQIETADDRVSGDANNDGTIDLKDVVMIRRYVAGGWDVELNADNADVNADNVVDLKDVVMLRRYIAGGWDVELA